MQLVEPLIVELVDHNVHVTAVMGKVAVAAVVVATKLTCDVAAKSKAPNDVVAVECLISAEEIAMSLAT